VTKATAVTLSVQWALHGKTPGDTQASRVLSWSTGDISKENFADAIGRFSTGTLEVLPQVTINWMVLKYRAEPGQPARAPVTYLALAINEETDERDATRQKITLTRYFAMPYAEMSARAISYRAIYDAVWSFAVPPAAGPALLLPVQATPPSAPSAGDLAARVAALLLTGKPVCVLGGRTLPVEARLQFLDTVLSLLPYGIRTKLTAATWASSTTPHHFRLFFSDAPRAGNVSDDHVVHWGHPERVQVPADCPGALDYLSWLDEALSQPMAELAAMDGEYGFADWQVARMLEALGIRDPGAGEALAGEYDGRATPPRLLGRRARNGKGAERILRGINDVVAARNLINLRTDLTALSVIASRPGGGSDPAAYRDIVVRGRLLRPDLAQGLGKLAGSFYTSVLRLAFGLPLSYEGYCQLEGCLNQGSGDVPPAAPRPLLEAVERGGLADPVVAILILSQLGGQSLGSWLRFGQVDFRELTGKLGAPALRPAHARQVCEAIGEYLAMHQGPDREEVAEILRDRQFLAPALHRHLPAEPAYQARLLTSLLSACYGKRIGKKAAASILGEVVVPPTPALLKAVTGMIADPADLETAMQAFAAGSLKSVTHAPGSPRPDPGTGGYRLAGQNRGTLNGTDGWPALVLPAVVMRIV
jgi:hypothetical protein